MRPRLTVAAALFPFSLAAQSPWREFDAYVAQAVRSWNVPGLAIAVVRDDSLVFAKGYGVRALGTTGPVTVHTRFANASTTKAFTALAVALMVDEGKLGWDDRVADRLPEFQVKVPYATTELTIRDLLTHRVGFGDPGVIWYGRTFDYAEMLRRLRFVTPESSLRSHFAYNNVTYATAGMIAGRVAGMSWDELVRTRILAPLGMTETVTQARDLAGVSDVALPHDYVNDTLRPLGPAGLGLVDALAPAGAMYSSVSDMAKWLVFLLDSGRIGGRAGKALVTPASFAELFRPQQIIGPGDGFYPTARLTHPHFTAYGFGWFLEDYRGEFVAFHTGSIDGTVAIVGLIPERRTGVVVFANRDHAEVRHALMYRAFDAVLGGPSRDWSRDLRALYDSLRDGGRAAERHTAAQRVLNTAPSLPLDRYAGTYRDSLFGDLVVQTEGGRLVAVISPFLTADLEHWHYDVFRLRWRHAWIQPSFATFHIGPAGTVAEVDLDGIVLGRAP